MKNSSSLNFFGILRCAKLMKCKALWVKVPNLYYLAIFLQISFMLMSNPLKTWPVKAMKTATLILPNHWAIFSTSSVAFLPRSRLKANICSNVMLPKMQPLFKVCILLFFGPFLVLFWAFFGSFWAIFSTLSVAFLPRSRLKANICSNVMLPKMQLLFKVCIVEY